ncbi:MAG: 2-dehydro-3-deoxygalactonokinase [Haliea sp.]|nr:MAG: 2-dehydro-3-deoxygalactonokinase [Haliea sp.]
MNGLIAVDWGTSSLRAALLDEAGAVLEETQSPRGILTVAPDEFAPLLIATCARWTGTGATFHLLCGMVGSRQGWQEAAYCASPCGFAEIADRLSWIAPSPGLERVAIVPGLSHDAVGVPDVMRGEETQVFGALALLGLQDARLVLPGTHSKWVRVRGSRIESFSTFMTGEFYALLRKHSILARTLPDADGALDEDAFLQGVAHARTAANLLHAAFSVRTMALFDRLPAAALSSYLSGLVIGEELRTQALEPDGAPVVLIGAPALTLRYEIALRAFGASALRVGSEATWRGLWTIARTLETPK